MTHADMLMQTVVSQLPKATYESPDHIDVPIPHDQTPLTIFLDTPPEQRSTFFHVITFRKVRAEWRELDGRLIERGYDYILIKR